MATTNVSEAPGQGGFFNLLRAASRPSLLALLVAPLAILTGVATYAIVTGLVPYNPAPSRLIALLLLHIVLDLSLGGLIAWRLMRLWRERRSGHAGARLHVRLVSIFIAIAVVPAILVAIFAAVTLNLGMEAWFSPRVKTALNDAVTVSRHYMAEKGNGIIVDAGAIADGLQLDQGLRDQTGHMRYAAMFEKLAMMTRDRGLSASFLIDSHGTVLGSTTKLQYTTAIRPSAADIAQAGEGQIVVDGNPETGVVRALIQLRALNDAYLLVVRLVDPKVFDYYRRTAVAVSEYHRLEQNRTEIQLIFFALYAAVSLVILLAAIWLGLWAANRLVRPISSLIDAAERVSEGDLKAQVAMGRDDDEVATLGRAFNRMTSQLDAQRTALIEANQQNDERRRFTETVLAGVSAGVLGLDADGNITIVNRAAARLLNADPDEIEGHHYSEAVPELAALIYRAISEPVGRASGDVTIKRGASPRTLSVQVASERGPHASGFAVTFDDITDLVSAQRTAAWADVARRIAHEIRKSADADPVVGRTAQAQICKRSHHRPRSVRAVHGHHHPAGRRHRAHGRRIFVLCAHADSCYAARERAGTDPSGGVPATRGQSADHLRDSVAPRNRLLRLRRASGLAGFDERSQERNREHRCTPRKRRRRTGAHRGRAGTKGRVRVFPHYRQWRRPAAGTSPSPDRTVCHDADQGHGTGPRDRPQIFEDHGGEVALTDADDEHGAEVTLKFPLQQKTAREKGAADEQTRFAHSAEILVVDDEEDIRDLVSGILRDEGFETRVAADSDSALGAMRQRRPQLAILDIWLQGSRLDGIQVLDTIKREQPDLPVVMISGHGTIETAVASIKKGAYDFIEKPFKADRLIHVVGRALKSARLKREVQELKLKAGDNSELVGQSSAISQLRQLIEKIAPTNSRVLITGPSGSGKEVVARLIHARSRRAANAFVAINCATMEPDRIEVELFGIESGDGPRKTGLFELAHNGTLFLDEVAEMPLETQGKILRVLVDQTFQRVGGTTRVQVDARLVSCTTRDPRAEIAAGRFREDLYHRLNVVPVRVPSLAEHRDDVPALVAHFMKRLSAASGLPTREIGDDAMAVLQAHTWPGNVRQLRNIVERLLILASDDAAQAVSADLLPADLGANAPWGGGGDLVISLPLREAREIFERDYLMAQINRFGGNISRTAAFIGMERSALHRKLKSLGVGPNGRESFNA